MQLPFLVPKFWVSASIKQYPDLLTHHSFASSLGR